MGQNDAGQLRGELEDDPSRSGHSRYSSSRQAALRGEERREWLSAAP
ncbi:hypothetical protein [Paenarthrobacter sp. FR1]